MLILLLCVGIYFLDTLVQKGANFALEKLDLPVAARVSEVDIDISETKGDFVLSANDTKTKKDVLDVRNITVDLKFRNWRPVASIYVTDTELTIRKDLLERLQQEGKVEAKPVAQNENEQAPSVPFILGFLGTVKVGNLGLHLVDENIRAHVDEMNLNYPQGLATVSNITGNYPEEEIKFIDIEKVDVSFNDELQDVAVNIKDLDFKVSQGLLDALWSYVPQNRQAQEEKKEVEGPADPLKMFKSFSIDDLDVQVLSKDDLVARVESVNIDFKKGTGEVSNISATTSGASSTEILDIKKIFLGFNPAGIIGKENAAIEITVLDPKMAVSEQILGALKSLPKPPAQNQKQPEDQEPFINQISKITVDNTQIHLKDQGLKNFIDILTVNMTEGMVVLENITSSMAQNKRKFLNLNKVSVKFNPQDLTTENKPELSIIVTDFHMKVSKKLLELLNKKKPQVSQTPPSSLPVRITKVLVGHSSIGFVDYPGIGKQKYLTVNDIFGTIYNISMEEGTPLGRYTFNATFEGDSKMIASGRLDLADKPIQWSMKWKLFGFDIVKLNKELRGRIPLTFKEGVFNLYGEAIQRDGNIVGYFKPFLDDASYFGNKKEFKGIRHFLAEAGASVFNWLFENSKTETVASRVPFTFKKGQLDFDVSEAIWSAVEHGLLETDRVKPRGNKYQLKQAQEER